MTSQTTSNHPTKPTHPPLLLLDHPTELIQSPWI